MLYLLFARFMFSNLFDYVPYMLLIQPHDCLPELSEYDLI